jgi:hypothetical protein
LQKKRTGTDQEQKNILKISYASAEMKIKEKKSLGEVGRTKSTWSHFFILFLEHAQK